MDVVPLIFCIAIGAGIVLLYQAITQANSPKSFKIRPIRPKYSRRSNQLTPTQAWSLLGALLLLTLIITAIQQNAITPPFLTNNTDAISLPPFQIMGRIPGTDGEISIRNSTPETMDVAFLQNNKVVTKGEIPRCSQCQTYAVAPPTCPTNGYSESYKMPPGVYTVRISWRGYVRPYFGRWQVAPSTAYSGCFTIGYSANQRTGPF